MNRSDSLSSDLVDQVIARKPLHRAQKAADKLYGVVADCVGSRFAGKAPASSVAYVTLITIATIGVSFIPGMGAFVFGPAAAIFFAIHCHGAPSMRLRRPHKLALAAASKLPAAPHRHLRQFAQSAKEIFLYARLAVAQEAVANAVDRPAWRVRQLERKGLRLTERTATKLHLTAVERGNLREAFKAGQLPRPAAYIDELNTAAQKLRTVLREP